MNLKQMAVAIVLTLLGVGLLWRSQATITDIGAQYPFEEDEIAALEAWGTTTDPHIANLLAAEVSTPNLSRSEVHLGYDKETDSYLDDPTTTRHTQGLNIQTIPSKEGSDIDPSRIRFGSNYEFVVEPGIALDVHEALSSDNPLNSANNRGAPYVVMQFNFPVDLALKADLEQKGVTFGDPIDKLSFYAKVPSHTLSDVNQAMAQEKINFVGAAPPEARIADALRTQIQEPSDETIWVTVQLFEAPTPEQIESLQTLMSVETVSNGPIHLVSGTVEAAQVVTLAQQPFVQWVEEQTLHTSQSINVDLKQDIPVDPTNLEGNLGAGADIVKKLGIDGSGINVAVLDSGIARQGTTYHPDLPASQIIDQYYWDPDSNFESADATDNNGHGTHVAGTIGGQGSSDVNRSWQGIAPGVKLLTYRLTNNTGGFASTDVQAAFQRAAISNTHVANNSWGGGNGIYEISAQLLDRAVRGEFGSRKINMIVTTGNLEGLSGTPGTAKNAISVGAVKDGNSSPQYSFSCPGGGSDDNWPPAERACFSNFGPINADGDGHTRVKPDIVAPGVQIVSPTPWYLHSSNPDYKGMNGTSMAAPQVSGAVAQFLQFHNSFLDWPEVVKAAFIVSATDVGGSANVNLYGRGMLNVVHAIYDQATISDIAYWNSALASSGNKNDHTFTVPTGFQEVRVALTWPDPVSGGGSDDVVNDLDVRVYDGSGALVGTSSTFDDTVEYVKISSGTPGTWRIEVDAFSISSSQTYGLASLIVLKNPDLSLSGSTARYPGGGFFLYTTMANSGFAAPGSYVQLKLPDTTNFSVGGARIYTSDGRSYYYPATSLHNDGGGQYWRAATGQTISGFPVTVRWFLTYSGTSCETAQFEVQAYYRSAGATTLEDTQTASHDPCESTYLPAIIK
ncbi:MAG: S8 family serine peptidase [Chloroflexota bacterium]